MSGDYGWRYEMNPCRQVVGGYEKCAETADDIAVWSVYRREWHGLVCWLSDHDTKKQALAELRRLKGAGRAMIPEIEKLIERYGYEHPDHPRKDWQALVASGDTIRGYWEWVWCNGLEEGAAGE